MHIRNIWGKKLISGKQKLRPILFPDSMEIGNVYVISWVTFSSFICIENSYGLIS